MEAPIPFTPTQESGFEPLGGASPVALNVVVSGKGVVERRPGIEACLPYPSGVISDGPIEAVYQEIGGAVFAFGSRADAPEAERQHWWTRLPDSPLGHVYWATRIHGQARPVFAQLADNGYVTQSAVTAGAKPHRIYSASYGVAWGLGLFGTSGWGDIGDVDTWIEMPTCTHVVAMSSRLLANELRYGAERVRYSEIADYNTWSAGLGTAGAFTAENSPDPLVALDRTREYLFAFGSQTTQVFSPDPTWVFAPVLTIPVGCSAPYSIIDCEYWIDQYKRVVRYQDGVASSVSSPIQAVLDRMTVSDAYGFRAELGAARCFVWVFPTDGRTFVLQEGVGWGQWQSGVPERAQFQVNAHCRLASGENLVGTLSGRVGKLSMAAATDFGDAVQARVETGYLARETSRRKVCKKLTVVLERGISSNPATAIVGYRDRPGPWRCRIPISLGSHGKTTHTLSFRNLGVYDRRQWFFEFSGAERLALVSATEEYEVI